MQIYTNGNPHFTPVILPQVYEKVLLKIHPILL